MTQDPEFVGPHRFLPPEPFDGPPEVLQGDVGHPVGKTIGAKASPVKVGQREPGVAVRSQERRLAGHIRGYPTLRAAHHQHAGYRLVARRTEEPADEPPLADLRFFHLVGQQVPLDLNAGPYSPNLRRHRYGTGAQGRGVQTPGAEGRPH